MADFVKRVQILIQKPGFTDAIYMSEDEALTLTTNDLQAMADERHAAYLQVIEDAKDIVQVEPTKEELEKYKAELQAQLDEVQAKIDSEGK